MDYSQLKLVYEKIYNISMEIDTLILEHKFEEVPETVDKRDKLMEQLEQAKIALPDFDQYPDEIKQLVQKLKEQELKNIERLEVFKTWLRKELEKTTKKSKLVSAYSGLGPKASSLVDVRE